MGVLEVIFSPQGTDVKRTVTFETGVTQESAINFGTLTYKPVLDRLDQTKFVDHYANYTTNKEQASMIGVSFIMGIFALILAYGIGLPAGLAMAKNKDGLIDKLGMCYIIFIIAVPSLAYIYLFRYLGTRLFGLPSAFPINGAGDIRSWILPIISLALPSISGLMLWTRRYVVDQMNSDYVKFAKAKGLNQKEIFWKHIFKNAVIPIVHGIPESLAGCITGAMITEAIYSVGGIGKMLPDSIKQYNNAMVVALTFMFATISVLSVLMGDILLTWVDPRISLSEKEGRA
jgi:oligopeptide transport system permease protein